MKDLKKNTCKKQDHNLEVFLTYCTNDHRFLKKCIQETQVFCKNITILTCDHFFNGEPEDRSLLNQAYHDFADCRFIEYKYLKDRLYSPYINRSPKDNDWFDFWYATTRYIPFFYSFPKTEYILFLDSDEIIEGAHFKNWLDTDQYKKYDAMRWLQYYYFREARYRAKKYQIGGLMAQKSSLTPSLLMNGDDRCGIFHSIQGNKTEGMAGIHNQPMIHHYSWVKTKNECLKKIESWSHHWEKDWKSLIEKEFSHEFTHLDFIDDREYETIDPPYFDPFSEKVDPKPISSTNFNNVLYIDDQVIRKKELSYEFGI